MEEKAVTGIEDMHAIETESDEKTMIDVEELVNGYLSEADWRVKENSNTNYSISGLFGHISGNILANYTLNHVYTKEIANAHKNCELHLHDLSHGICGYCGGWSLRNLINDGFDAVKGSTSSGPPKHLSAVLGLMVNFTGILQGEFAGAMAWSSFDTLLAPFVREDNLSYYEVKQEIQQFVFNMNVPSRWSGQCPFSNLTFDLVPPIDLIDEYPEIDGDYLDYTYADLQQEMDMINLAFIEVMNEGDSDGRPHTFPIPTYNISDSFQWSGEVSDAIFNLTARLGTPYFANFIGSDMSPSDSRSMCVPGTTEIIYSNENGDVCKNEIRHIVNSIIERDNDYKILVGNKFVPIKTPIKLKYNDDLIEIELYSGIKQRFSKDHLCLTRKGLKRAEELNIGDEIPLRKDIYETELGSFDHGRIVGLFLGDGWTKQNTTAGFCFGKNEMDIVNFVKDFAEEHFNADTYIREYETYINIFVKSKGFVHYIKEYYLGNSSHNKRLTTKVYNRNSSFRKGIIVGLMDSDGYIDKKQKLIHLINRRLLEDIQKVGYTINQNTRLRKNHNRTGNKRKISWKLYLDKGTISNYFDNKKPTNEIEEYNWNAIKNIEKFEYEGYLYDFEIDSKEHLFSLANGIITHNCCRLSIDLRELRSRGGGLFGSGEMTGSIGVVSINLPRIGYISNNEEEFYAHLDHLMEIAKDSLEIKRVVIDDSMKSGLLPFTARHLKTFHNHFSTIGLIGMHEMCVNFLNVGIETPKGRQFSLDVLDFMREKMGDFQEETGNLYNLEATPGEGLSARFPMHDKETYSDIYTSGEEGGYFYTNSCHLPVNHTKDIIEVLKHQSDLQKKFTGGTVIHTFVPERLNDGESAKNFIKKALTKFPMPYLSLTPTYSICKKHGYIAGEHFLCPICGDESDVYTRVVGYFRPVQNWNHGKRSEYAERVPYHIEDND